MRFNTIQLPRDSRDFVRGITANVPYVVRVLSGDWTIYFPTFKDQRADGYDTDCCWLFAGITSIETQCNFLLMTNAFPQSSVDWFKANGYIDSNGKFAFSQRFIAALATYSDGTPVRDGGNDQIQCPKLVNQWGLLPRADFTDDPNLTFSNQEAFDDYYFDKTQITPAMYAKAKQFMTLLSIAYWWASPEGTMPPMSVIQTDAKQSPPQLGIPIPQDTNLWNGENIQYDGTTAVSHSVTGAFFPQGLPSKIGDQYQPEFKYLSTDYLIPMVSMIYVTPIVSTSFVPPANAIPLPSSTNLFVMIWTAIRGFWGKQGLGKVKMA